MIRSYVKSWKVGGGGQSNQLFNQFVQPINSQQQKT